MRARLVPTEQVPVGDFRTSSGLNGTTGENEPVAVAVVFVECTRTLIANIRPTSLTSPTIADTHDQLNAIEPTSSASARLCLVHVYVLVCCVLHFAAQRNHRLRERGSHIFSILQRRRRRIAHQNSRTVYFLPRRAFYCGFSGRPAQSVCVSLHIAT